MVAKPTSLSVICLAIATYSIQPFFGSCSPPPIAVKVLAAVFIGEYRRSIQSTAAENKFVFFHLREGHLLQLLRGY
jgi:hypothetical protein